MRSLLILLLVFVAGTTACSKKNSSVATAPAPTDPIDPGPGPDPLDTNYDLNDDQIILNKRAAAYFEMNYGNDAQEGYFQLLHSAFSYQSKYGASATYGTNTTFPYETGRVCNNAFLDDIYNRMGYAFYDCADYTDYLEYLIDGEIYLEATLISSTTVEGKIHATILYPPPTYHVSEFITKYRGKVTKEVVSTDTYYYNIQIGSALLLYSADNHTSPEDRYLTLDFGSNEIGSVQLITQ